MCGPVTRPITFASIPKWPSVSSSVRATCSWPAVSGLAASPVERVRNRARGHPPHEVRVVGDRGAVAALRASGRRADLLAGPSRAPSSPSAPGSARRSRRARRRVGSSSVLARPAIGGASTWVARTTSSAVSGSGGSSGSGSAARQSTARGPHRRRLDAARLAAAPRRRPAPGAGRRLGDRRSSACSARLVPATPAPVARITPASVAPLTRISAGEEQEHGEDVGAERRDQVRGDPELGLADDAAARLERAPAARTRGRASGPGRARACRPRAPA